MNKILIISGRYLPGYKDGGPLRTILNLTEWMGDEYDIRIMCLDRDMGDTERYPDIKVDEWNQVGKAKVWYTQAFTARNILKASDDADLVYCCGPYNDYSVISMLLKKNRRMSAPLVIASMGSFSPGAFAIKNFKKKWYVRAMRAMGMFRNIYWSVTSEREEEELKAIVGENARCVLAADLGRREGIEHTSEKKKDALKILFLSRISRKKNLIAVPDILKEVNNKFEICIDIYGIAEDEEYLKECLEKFDKLPANIKWDYKGEIDPENVLNIFAGYDAFLFPTMGENYGHVIAEALSAGCVPIISDQTPWMDLHENDAGYVCKFEEYSAFADAVNELAVLDTDEYSAKSDSCREYILRKNTDSVRNSGYRKIFDLNYK